MAQECRDGEIVVFHDGGSFLRACPDVDLNRDAIQSLSEEGINFSNACIKVRKVVSPGPERNCNFVFI